MIESLPQPPTPQQLEDVLHTIMRQHPEYVQDVVSTNSMGGKLVVRIRNGCTTRMRGLLQGLAKIEIQEIPTNQELFDFMKE